MSDTKTYTCVACGDDKLTGEPGAEAYLLRTLDDGLSGEPGPEAYLTERPDSGERAMCRWCIDRSMDAERAAEAALRDAAPSEVADAMVRVLRAWATVDAESELYQAR